MSEYTGQCLCGAVRFRAETVETHHHACHCGMCRRWSSAPFFAAAAQNVRFDGAGNITRYDTSEWADRGFCKKCGTNLFYHFKQGDQYMLSVGAFDDPSQFTLVGEIYIDAKPEGYGFAGDLPKMTEAEVIEKFTGPGED